MWKSVYQSSRQVLLLILSHHSMKISLRSILFSCITFVFIAALSAGIFLSTQQKSYSADQTKQWFTSELISNISNKLDSNKTRQGLIEAYCAATANAQWFSDPATPGLYYDARQSLFLGLLCTHVGARDGVSTYVGSYDREDLRISGCEWDGSMSSCDFSVLLPELFALVMNDVSKVKLAQLYSNQWASSEEAIKVFSDTYFGPGDTICGSKNLIYLGTSHGSDKEAPCTHPKTNVILAQFLQQAQQIGQQTIYLNTQPLISANPKNCSSTPSSLLSCAFTTPWDAFHNLLYNELLFYKIFITLVNDRIQYPEYNPFRVYSDTSTKARQEIISLGQEQQLSEQSIMYMEKTLQNMQATFPIHIGLLAYYEDIIALRKSLTRIYTPIHQLYYKLRNVQQKQ